MAQKTRVRYAPSPTGLQHIGGIRTALFDYFYAKASGGDFILRIEDTDQARSFEGAMEDIYNTFEWLGIEYDEGPKKGGPYAPYIQSERVDIYKKYSKELIDKGHAYYCYCDAERLEKVRKEKEQNKEQQGYDRRCRNLSKEEEDKLKKENPKPVIRLKVPVDGITVFEDSLFGKIEFDNKTLQDFVLLKSDGFPTYHLASVVDDHLMEITHVLRGQEWMPSAANHMLLFKAFGWETPVYCHLPLIMGEDGHKLSKRHGATQVIEFKNQGYLPEALINFVTLLGWSYNDKDELFGVEQLKKIFTIDKINKSPATFNYSKLKWFNGIYIRSMDNEKLLNMLIPYFKQKGLVSENVADNEIQTLRKIVPLVKERIEVLADAPEISYFMFGELPEYRNWDMIMPKNTEKQTVISILKDAKAILDNLGKEKDEDMQHQLYELSTKYSVKAGAVFMPIRIALTGTNKSPDLFPVMNALGKDKVLNRIEKAIEKLK